MKCLILSNCTCIFTTSARTKLNYDKQKVDSSRFNASAARSGGSVPYRGNKQLLKVIEEQWWYVRICRNFSL